MLSNSLVKTLVSSLVRPLISAIRRVFINLESTAGAYYSLSTPWVTSGDFEVECDFVGGESVSERNLIGADSDKHTRLVVRSDGYMFFLVGDGSSWKVLLIGTTIVTDNKLHTAKGSKVGNVYTLTVDGVVEATVTLTFGAVPEVLYIGKSSAGTNFDGIISNVKLTDLTTPANSLEFKLDELTANTETNNGVTLTYENIATDVRDTYTLVDGAWLGSSIIDDANASLGAEWTYNGGGSYTYTHAEGSDFTNLSFGNPSIADTLYRAEVTLDTSTGANNLTLRNAGITNLPQAAGTYTYDLTANNTQFPNILRGGNVTAFTQTISGIVIKRLIDIAPQITPVTQGMTLTEAWVTRGTAYNALDSATSASVRVDATISNTDTGILMESGGSTAGLMLYVYSGVLYFQCGDGTGATTAANRAVTSYAVPVGSSDYIIEWSANTSNSVLYVNGIIVDSQVFTRSSLSGNDAGTVGRVANTCAVNLGGWTTDGSGDYTNTITKCDIFDGQVTADV